MIPNDIAELSHYVMRYFALKQNKPRLLGLGLKVRSSVITLSKIPVHLPFVGHAMYQTVKHADAIRRIISCKMFLASGEQRCAETMSLTFHLLSFSAQIPVLSKIIFCALLFARQRPYFA